MEVRYPDFFIIGAPKCGTSALYSYLRDHPQIYLPDLKEPQFFCSDFPELCQVSGPKGYSALFARAPANKLVGEGSIWYLFSTVAVPKILEVAPNAKFIVMLRNPVEMAMSLHSQFLLTLQEDQDDFRNAWDLQDRRLANQCLPNHCPEPLILQYRRACALGEQLQRLYSTVDRSQVKVLRFDAFTQNTKPEYETVLKFLEVGSDDRSDFKTVNARRAYAFPRVIAVLREPPMLLKPGIFLGRQLLNRFGIHPTRYLRRYLTVPTRSSPLDPNFRAQLTHAFRDDIELLESMLAVNLNHWKE